MKQLISTLQWFLKLNRFCIRGWRQRTYWRCSWVLSLHTKEVRSSGQRPVLATLGYLHLGTLTWANVMEHGPYSADCSHSCSFWLQDTCRGKWFFTATSQAAQSASHFYSCQDRAALHCLLAWSSAWCWLQVNRASAFWNSFLLVEN